MCRREITKSSLMTCSKSDEAAEERDLVLVMQKNNKTVLFVPGSTDNPLDLSQ